MRSDILTAVAMKIPVIWDVLSSSLTEICQHYGGTYEFYTQGRIVRRWQHIPAKSQQISIRQ